MANSTVPPPGAFNFSKPDEWLRRYQSAAGLAEEAETRQVDMLLYCMGEEAEEVLTSQQILALKIEFNVEWTIFLLPD